jgi:hypothetical protein
MSQEDEFDPNNVPPLIRLLMLKYAEAVRRGDGEGGSGATAYKFRVLVQQHGKSLQYAEAAEKFVSGLITEQWNREHR